MLASTTTYHASDGAAYERFLGRWTSALATRLLDFAEFPPDGPLLDVGTGTGSLAVAMATRWPSRRIIGIDVAEPYIQCARSRSTASLQSFEVGEAARLPFCPGAFSGAAAQLVLNFIPNTEAAVREMRRVIRRGGRDAAAVWEKSKVTRSLSEWTMKISRTIGSRCWEDRARSAPMPRSFQVTFARASRMR